MPFSSWLSVLHPRRVKFWPPLHSSCLQIDRDRRLRSVDVLFILDATNSMRSGMGSIDGHARTLTGPSSMPECALGQTLLFGWETLREVLCISKHISQLQMCPFSLVLFLQMECINRALQPGFVLPHSSRSLSACLISTTTSF